METSLSFSIDLPQMFDTNFTSLYTNEVGIRPETLGKGLWPTS